MKKRKILTIIAIAAAFAVAVGFAVQGHSRAERMSFCWKTATPMPIMN